LTYAIMLKVIKFLALILTALALVPAGAHLFELFAKIGMPREQYLIVQQIYRGWAFLGAVLILAVVANLVLTIALARRQLAFRFAAAAFVFSAVALAIFFIWTYPVNIATDNWTSAPVDWESLRARWEYSHAAAAGLLFAALCSLTLSVLKATDMARRIGT
jgi:hypothetical protein